MGLVDALRRLAGNRQPSYTTPSQPIMLDLFRLRDEVLGMSPAEVWRTQPHLRTVTSFRARNIAQLGLHTFQRVGENDRRRDRDSPVSRLLARPNPFTTGYQLVYGTVLDRDLYDVAYLHLAQDPDSSSGWSLYRLPPEWVTPQGGDAFGFDSFLVSVNGGANKVGIPADRMIVLHGWDPVDTRLGSASIRALKTIIAEQAMAMKYRQRVWEQGGKVSAALTRPKDAPWSDAARESFRADWKARFTGDGADVGGTPILEDGMTLNKLDFNATEQQFVEAAKLALGTVASVYHVNPTMVGVLDNANYSNVREFRKMLYGDSLGPDLADIEDLLNTLLVPRVDPRPGVYVEFNIAEKLQGSFEEQTAAISSATGRPYMTADEARGRLNLPSLGGDADQLVTPLNVLIGGQASPRDSAPPPKATPSPAGPVRLKARAPDTYEAKHAQVTAAFFRRQGDVVKSRLGAKAAADLWDADRWDRELADDLYKLALLVSKDVAASTLESIGFDPDQYDTDRTLAWLRAVSENTAKAVNETTLAQIQTAVDAEDPKAAVAQVFDTAESQRAPALAATAVTVLSSFGTHEAAYQVAPDKATKTWITGKNPRPAHAALNGQTVLLSENFANGAAWPGDGDALGPDDLAGCNCSLEVSVP